MHEKAASITLALALLAQVGSAFACSKNEYIDDPAMCYLDYTEDFKIAVLADLQVKTVEECKEVFVKVDGAIEAQEPDLVVLLGDNLFLPRNGLVLDELIAQMEKFEIPYAPVFGNHDAEGFLSKDFIAEQFENAEHCLFLRGVEGEYDLYQGGYSGNYAVHLMEKGAFKFSFYFLDSNMYRESKTDYDYLYPEQVEWYGNTVQKIAEVTEREIPSFLFFHIPLPEFKGAYATLKKDESAGVGTFYEKVCCSALNSGLFERIKELGSTKAVFCGHDHVNHCDILHEGVRLNYCLKSSEMDYHVDELLGMTTITIAKDSSFKIEPVYFD